MKKKGLIISAIVVLVIVSIIAIHFVANGFAKRTDVVILEYSVSQDKSITMQTTLAGSMGFIRDMEVERKDNKLYVSFYQTFGPLNSDFGAKDTYTIEIDSECTDIYFEKYIEGNVEWDCVLHKDEVSGQWVGK